MKSLGVFGVGGPDYAESGVGPYVSMTSQWLRCHYRVTVVDRFCEASPRDFDLVLYHITASIHSLHAHYALQTRPGPAIVHEHNCLLLYYEIWEELPNAWRRALLNRFSSAVGGHIASLNEALAYGDHAADADRYSLDIGAEAIIAANATPFVSHSQFVVDELARRHPQTPFVHIPHPAQRFGPSMAMGGRNLLGVGRHSTIFGVFGRIGEYKRLEVVLAAWRGWQRKPSGGVLLIVGEKQYDLDIPVADDILYLGRIDSDSEFNSMLAAVDVGIALRHPSLGETSGVVTKLVANGTPTVLSETPYTAEYEELDFVRRVAPDGDEVAELRRSLEELSGRRKSSFDERFSLEGWGTAIRGILNTHTA